MTTTTFTDAVTLTAASWFNDIDVAGYPVLSSVAGTNTITATGPANYSLASTRAPLVLIPAVTNTSSVTLAITPSGGSVLTAKNVFVNGAACAGGELRAGVPVIIEYDGAQFNAIGVARASTRQVLTSGTSATYTTPTGARQLRIRVKAGGGGGGGSGSDTAATSGGTGGTSSFNSIDAAGGSGGTAASGGVALPGAGGTGGSGSASFRIPGAPGSGSGAMYASSTNAYGVSGSGGGSGGGYQNVGAGQAGVANSGGGGSGASTASLAFASVSGWEFGGAGGEGETFELIINSPSATYTYTVGAGGTAGGAGASGSAGGAGGTGLIVVDEFY